MRSCSKYCTATVALPMPRGHHERGIARRHGSGWQQPSMLAHQCAPIISSENRRSHGILVGALPDRRVRPFLPTQVLRLRPHRSSNSQRRLPSRVLKTRSSTSVLAGGSNSPTPLGTMTSFKLPETRPPHGQNYDDSKQPVIAALSPARKSSDNRCVGIGVIEGLQQGFDIDTERVGKTTALVRRKSSISSVVRHQTTAIAHYQHGKA